MDNLWLIVITYIAGIVVMTPLMIMSLISWKYPAWLSILSGFVMAIAWPWMGFLLIIGYPMFNDQYFKNKKAGRRKK